MKRLLCFIAALLLINYFSNSQIYKTIDLTTSGTLSSLLSNEEKRNVTNLTLTGNVDTRDFKCMRDEMSVLSVLDISPRIGEDGGGVATCFAGGDGTYGNPYQISNASELAFLAQQVNDITSETNRYGNNYSYGKYFVLTANIDLNGANNNWTPIGNNASWEFNNKFQGTFEGANFEIQNMKVDVSGNEVYLYAGLFGYIGTESIIRNINISASCNVKVTGYGVQMLNFAASVVAYNNGLVENCLNSGSVSAVTDDSN